MASTNNNSPRPAAADFSLNAARRDRELAALAAGETVDLLVIGLGVTGAGVALDAASRGLSVAAVDAHDLAFGTSRWSSKLVHGGLRYLAKLDFGIAYESAVERGILMEHTAPHLVRPLAMLAPLTNAVAGRDALLLSVGLRAGDILRRSAGTSTRTLPPPRRLTAVETAAMAPALRTQSLRGGLLSFDGQLTDDARLVVALARTAAGHGARILTRCRAESLDDDGAEVLDTITGTRHTLRARAVINATGVWADRLVPGVTLRPSRGTHLVLPASLFGDPGAGRGLGSGLGCGLTIAIPGTTSRYVLVLPQPDGRVYVGLTDEPVDGPIPDVPEVPETDIGFLLDILNAYLEIPIRRGDVIGAFAGLRPLLDAGGGKTADMSRRHAVLTAPNGVVTVVGGKLTTYRRMAQDAVDQVVAVRKLSAGPCRTSRLPLVGSAPVSRLNAVDAPQRLIRKYGIEAPSLLADPELTEPIGPGIPTTRAELLWAVRHEGALDAEDVLDRRTRIGLVPQDRVAALTVVDELGIPVGVGGGRG